MIVIIDNYDSFTYNLVEHYRNRKQEVFVSRNDKISLKEISEKKPSLIVISPGPKSPLEAGLSVEIVKHFAGTVPLFGVCLGCQAIAVAFGGKIIRAEKMYHGKTSLITHDAKGVLAGVTSPMSQMRYHSLIVEESSLSIDLEISARSETGEIMGLRHRNFLIEGMQFHPESIASKQGDIILDNSMAMTITQKK